MLALFDVLVGTALVLTVTFAAGAVTLYRRFPAWVPREETALGPRGYAFVRASVVGGVFVGATGALVDVLGTTGTILSLTANDPGTLVSIAAVIPPGAGRTLVLLGVTALVGGGVVATAVEIRAFVSD